MVPDKTGIIYYLLYRMNKSIVSIDLGVEGDRD